MFDRGNSKLDKGRDTKQENIQGGSVFFTPKTQFS